MKKKKRAVAVLFDIDGTLITTGGAGAVAWRLAFDELYGIPADIGKYTEAGQTDPEVGRITFVNVIGREPMAAELATLMTKRLAHLPQAVAEAAGYRILPGLPAALDRLVDRGLLLGLTTGNVEAAAHIKLERAGLNRYFSFGGYGSDSNDRGELTKKAIERAGTLLGLPVDPSETVVVGDTPKDVTAALYAGAVAVAVATGHFTRDELAEAGADHVLGSLEEEMPLS
jgi:phosphoglycolate phosphatase